jgi:DNA-binding SARP family transcriptional activator
LRHVLGLDPAVRVDLREAQAAAHRVLDCGRVDPELAMPLLSARLLPDWGDQWVLLEQQRVQQMHAQCLEILGYQLLDEQRYVHAMQAAVAACRMEPLRESARRAVVDVLVAEGNGLLASQVQKAFRELLQAELG